MTHVTLIRRGGALIGYEMSGHASDTLPEGEAVVCAALSSAAYMAVNTITDVLGVDASVSVSDGYMKVTVPKDAQKKCAVVLAGLALHLEAMAEDYPKEVELINMEVQYNAED